MALETETTKEVKWSQRHTDFVIVVKSGKELRVHKHVLADNSPVFEAMLNKDMMETKANMVKIEQYAEETVITFLEYIYEDQVKDQNTINLMRAAVGPKKHIFRRTAFEHNKFTVDLMGMAHFYEVKDLEEDCCEYLKENVCDENLMNIWMEAEKCGNRNLCSVAIEHLVDRPKDKPLKDVPGFMKAFEAYDNPIQDLLAALCDKNLHLSEENGDLKEKIKRFEDLGLFKITVIRCHAGDEWTEEFYVRPSDLVSTLIEKIKNQRPINDQLKEYVLDDPTVDQYIKTKKSLEENNIRTDTTLKIWKHNVPCTILAGGACNGCRD